MTLKAIMESLDGLPEEIANLYTEKDGKFELTGIIGIKTNADVDRVATALEKERAAHKDTKSKLSEWSSLGEYEEVVERMDRFPELEAAAGDKLDESSIEDMVNRRIEGRINTVKAPLERKITELSAALETANETVGALTARERDRTITDEVRGALTEAGVIPEAQEDALLLAKSIFEIREDDGAVVVKPEAGFVAGAAPKDWILEVQPKRAHWWPATEGGGAKGGTGKGGLGDNPWSKDNWNMTKQAEYYNTHGAERAAAAAKAAGTTLGGKPAA